MRGNNISGTYGERYAAAYLEEHGYKLICTNYKTSFAEIDIIAREKETDTLCFIEVKTRKNKNYGAGADFIFKSKRDKMILGARAYISYNNPGLDIRFDVIEVYGSFCQSGFCVNEINHIKNAFYAES